MVGAAAFPPDSDSSRTIPYFKLSHMCPLLLIQPSFPHRWLNGNPFTSVPCDWGVDTAVTTNIQLPGGVWLADCVSANPTASPTANPSANPTAGTSNASGKDGGDLGVIIGGAVMGAVILVMAS